MPVYTYQCDSCGVRFDRYQKFTDQSLTWCPECSKKSLRKVYQPVGIVFKGSGFYATDHKSPSGGQNVNAPKTEKGEGGDKPSDGEKAGAEKSTESTNSSSKKAPSTTSPGDES